MSSRALLSLSWGLYDRAYAWLHRLRDLPIGGRPYLRFELTRCRRSDIELADGNRLTRGDTLLLLHLNGAELSALRRELGSPVRAGLAFRRILCEAFEVLARRLPQDPALAEVRAVGAVTHLWHGSHRLGFSVVSPRGRLWARVVATYQRRLMRQHAGHGHARPRGAGGRDEARLIVISTTTLVRRYGVDARRVPTETAA